jgi:WD40 repeat protein
MNTPDAHASTVYSIISIADGKQFLTCSADAQIKLWGNKKDFSFNEPNDTDRKSTRKIVPLQAINLGEMWGHTDQVKILLKLSETTFVSGGHDNLIILWYNGEEQSILRTQEAAEAIQPFYDCYSTDEQLPPEPSSALPLPDPNHSTPPTTLVTSSGDSSGNLPQDTDPDRTTNETEDSEEAEVDDPGKHSGKGFKPRNISPPPLSPLHKSGDLRNQLEISDRRLISAPMLFRSKDTQRKFLGKIEVEKMSHSPRVLHIDQRTGKKVKIPNYLFDKAENLMKEKQLSLAEIRQILSGEGHSDLIVEAVIVELEKVPAAPV